MNEITYKCKFCGRPGKARYHPDFGKWFNLEGWASILTCNRCADYNEKIRVLSEAIGRQTYKLNMAIVTGDKAFDGIEKVIRIKLVALTEKYAKIFCRHHFRDYYWNQNFVEELISNPTKTQAVLGAYKKMVTGDRKKLVA